MLDAISHAFGVLLVALSMVLGFALGGVLGFAVGSWVYTELSPPSESATLWGLAVALALAGASGGLWLPFAASTRLARPFLRPPERPRR